MGSLSWPAACEAKNKFKVRVHAAKTRAASRKHLIPLTQSLRSGPSSQACFVRYIHLSIDALLPWRMFATWKNALAWPPQTTRLMS